LAAQSINAKRFSHKLLFISSAKFTVISLVSFRAYKAYKKWIRIMNGKQKLSPKVTSPTPSMKSTKMERDASDENAKINIEKMMGDTDDEENMSGFDSDSEDEAYQNGHCK